MLLDDVDEIESRIQNTQFIVILSVNNVEAKTSVSCMQNKKNVYILCLSLLKMFASTLTITTRTIKINARIKQDDDNKMS